MKLKLVNSKLNNENPTPSLSRLIVRQGHQAFASQYSQQLRVACATKLSEKELATKSLSVLIGQSQEVSSLVLETQKPSWLQLDGLLKVESHRVT